LSKLNLCKTEKVASNINLGGKKLKTREICKLLNAKVLAGEHLLDNDIESAFGSDLMSDVLTFANGRMALLTGLNNPQVIRTAEMSDIPLIIFVRGRTPSEEVVKMASERDICILATEFIMYEACGTLYKAGLLPCTRLSNV
jgi:predicted transcriptional regulator